MNARLVRKSILLFGLFFIIITIYDYSNNDRKYSHNPVHMSSYEISGYYAIDPNTILAALNHGETNVFLPLQGDPFTTEELANVNISWTQADYIQIANALSQLVWGEPLDFKRWKVSSLDFRIGCQSAGFDYGEITYFRPYEVIWYTTRHIEIDPYSGIVRWGDRETYPQPILFNKWNDFDLPTSSITADDALRIANENGGADARLKEGNKCHYINISIPNSDKNNVDKWDIYYISNRLFFEIYIDPYTGEFEVQESNK